MTTLSEWDRTIAPHLHRLEDHSSYIAQHAQGVAAASEILRRRPAWLTKAEAQMARAERDLRLALETVQQARAKYIALPEVA